MSFARFIAWIKLGRFLFLGGGFVFFALGSSIAHYNGLTIDVTRYILGQLIVTSTQLMVQYSNDYFDFQADLANQTPTRWSGGSRILPSGQLPPQIALYTAWGLGLIAISLSLLLATIESASSLTILIITIAFALSWNYSGPPLRLHSHGLGEITAAIVVPVLTPMLAYSLQTDQIDSVVLLSVIPLALLQFNMLLAVHLPDVEGDAAVGKRTFVVILGRDKTCRLYQMILLAAYFVVPLLMIMGLPTAVGLSMVVPMPLALWLFWRLQNGHGRIADHWDNIAFWTIGLLMGTGVLETLAYVLSS